MISRIEIYILQITSIFPFRKIQISILQIISIFHFHRKVHICNLRNENMLMIC